MHRIALALTLALVPCLGGAQHLLPDPGPRQPRADPDQPHRGPAGAATDLREDAAELEAMATALQERLELAGQDRQPSEAEVAARAQVELLRQRIQGARLRMAPMPATAEPMAIAPPVCTRKRLFPVRDERTGECFWGGSGPLLTNASAGFWKGGGSLYAELFRGMLGPVRMGIGALADSQDPNKADEDQKAAVQRLLSNGGNLAVTLAFPLVFLSFNQDSYLAANLYGRAAGDVPPIGGESTDPSLNGEFGLIVQLRIIERDRKRVGVFVEARGGAIAGTRPFTEAIGRGGTDPFGVLQVGGGIILGNFIQVGVHSVPGQPADLRQTTPKLTVRTTLISQF